MYIRIKKTPNSPRKTIQIVEGTRFGNKVKQKIVRYVGVATTEPEEVKLRAIAELAMADIIKQRASDNNVELSDDEIKALSKRGKKSQALLKKQAEAFSVPGIHFESIREEYRFNSGIDDIVGIIFDSLGFNQLLDSPKQNKLLKAVILARLIYPYSKFKLCEMMLEKWGKMYNEEQIYRMMDKLYPKINNIKRTIFNRTRSLMPNVNVLLFDVTTLYCESIVQDELREFGFSKDGKLNNTQLVLSLATNELGMPIGYELFPGNCAEVKTLLPSINKWSSLFNIKDACFIGDRAMFSEDNIKLIEQHGYKYIIAARLRSMPDDLKSKLLNEKNYQPIVFGDETGRIAEFDYPNSITQVRCTLETNDNESGYIVVGSRGSIQTIYYQNLSGKKIQADDENFKQYKIELDNLRFYKPTCKCILLTKEEYSIFIEQPETIKNIALVVGDDIIYNDQRIRIQDLGNTLQNKIIAGSMRSKIASSVMSVIFKEQYKYKTYINIPCEIMAALFSDYRIATRRLCVSYKPSRAFNDERKRMRILDKLQNKQGNVNKVVKTSAKIYMSSIGKAALDQEKIIDAEKWDGIHGVLTNIISEKLEDILSKYTSLWRIEEAFRINKHHLQMRPIYHYKPERIHTHIAMCYMGFALLKLIQYQTQVAQPRFTINDILSVLLSVEYSVCVDTITNVRYKLPGHMTDEAKALYKAFGVPINERISTC